MIFGGRMEIGWLRRNFSGLNEDSTEVQREQHAQAYILQIIGGILMPDKSRNIVHLRFKQLIPVALQGLDDLYHIDLWGRMDKNWLVFHAQYINMWNNRYEFLPTREVIIAPELACDSKYMQWFRVYGKPYLLGEEEMSRQPHTRRPQPVPINPRSSEASPSSTLM
ncbi:hypothetical protein Goshw_019904 [Gossypium schwendimanii]|uniref:Aminotransferase-like plant mobile domain-containing protein n=1 Tax=Gossypium schwendimanii TaxID=34291 RepID=A0A7J9LAY2_GOSSC|nr:hypothetical protein [Gossypium schwendimanii]